MKKILLLLLLLFDLYAHNLLPTSKLYVADVNMSAEELLDQPALLQPYDKEFINIGYAFDKAVWVEFEIANDSDEVLEQTILEDSALVDLVELYWVNDCKVTKVEKSGIFHRLEFDYLIGFHFNVKVPAHTTQKFLLRVTSATSSTHFSLYQMEYEEFVAKDIKRQFVLMILFGAIGALMIYNLANYFITKDSLFILYALYLFGILWNQISMSSLILYPIFWNEEILAFAYEHESKLGTLNMSLVILFMALFIRKFLDTKQYPKLDKGLIAITAFGMVMGLYGLVDNSLLGIIVLISFSMVLYFYLVGVYAYFQKNRYALVFLMGWGVYLAGLFTYLGYQLGGFSELYFNYPYLMDAAVMIEAFVFSYAIGSRINQLQTDKAVVESELASRERLIREIHHRVKNSMQIIISIYRLKLRKYFDSEVKQSTTEAENTVRAMSRLHELLYNQKDLVDVNTQQYIEDVIDHIRRGFDMQGIRVELMCSAKIRGEELTYVAIILNELMTNSVKYAFANIENPKITIELTNEQLYYHDNGVGFEDELLSSSYGLMLVQSIVSDELGGTFTKFDRNSFEITLKA
jgi:two-component sensor histidine kinase